ncbi:MAG: Gfo/Idh/MocA family oxidoreductase [Thermoguttaceae bacterium]|nr:Gfo/Idh/MocA family oxidoreductase [Thermoguttaceae bacterium]
MKRTSRREFLSDSILAAATMSVLGSAMTGSKARAQGRPLGPNETLGVMVVGCGGRGTGSHIPEFLEDPRTKILYVCDPDQAQAARAADMIEEEQKSRPKIVADMRDALDDKSLDIVSCATTNHWHALTGIWAMQAGKDAYLEKPICHNVHEGQALIAAAKKYGRCCQVGSQCRSNPAVQEAFRYAADGKLGEIKLTRGLCYKRRRSIGPLGAYPVPEGIDYNLWSGPAPIVDPVTRPNFHYDWHWQRLYGNGDLGNQGPHQTDIARTFLGVTEFPSSVIAYGGRLGYQTERQDDNYVDAGDTANTEVSIYNYRNGKTLVFETRGLETDPLMGVGVGVIAYGSEGYMIQSSYGFVAVFDPDGNEVTRFTGGDDSYHFCNFIDCVINGTPEKLNADARAGHLSAGLSHLGNISYYLGEKNYVSPAEAEKIAADIPGNDDNVATLRRTLEHLTNNGVNLEKTPLSMGVSLKFDPDKEVFVDNDAANAMLTREYRGEFVVPNPDEV